MNLLCQPSLLSVVAGLVVVAVAVDSAVFFGGLSDAFFVAVVVDMF